MDAKQNIEEFGIEEFAARLNSNYDKPGKEPKTQKQHFLICNLNTSTTRFKDFPEVFATDFYSVLYLKDENRDKVKRLDSIVLEDAEISFSRPGEMMNWRLKQGENGILLIFTKEYLLTLIENKNFLNSFDCLITNVNERIELDTNEHRFFENALKEMMHEYSNPSKHSQTSIKLWLSVLLIKVNRICRSNDNVAPETNFSSSADFIYHRFLTALEENFRQLSKRECLKPHSVSEFAQKLNINPSYLNECVKKASRKTAKSLINERWLLMAKCQLMHTSDNISEIAYNLGFESPGYFTRFFKKFEVVSPVEFRKLSNLQ